MKRDDETLLEYLIRLAKEKGEGLGEGLQELGVERLKKARPDVAARRGLLEPQYDETMMMEEASPFPDRSPAFIDDDITSLMSTQQPTPDRASLEAMITQAGERRPFEEPQPLQEWTGVGPAPEADPALMQRMLTQPSATDSTITNWAGVGQAPGEDPSLMQQDLEQTRAREGAQSFDQVTSGPITPRVPTADIAAASPVNFPGTQVGPMSNLERARIRDVPVKEEGEDSRGFLEKAGDFLGIGATTEQIRDFSPWGRAIWDNILAPQIAAGGTMFMPVRPELAEKLKTKNKGLDKVAEFLFGEKKEPDTEEIDNTWKKIDQALGKDVEKVDIPTVKQAEKSVEKQVSESKKSTPSYNGYDSKAKFFKAMGLLGTGSKSNMYAKRMDDIDSESNMFSMIAMLGGAGNSRAGTNFRNKSYQRLRAEMDIEQKDWDRRFKIFEHPWDVWYSEEGLRSQARLRGMGPPDMGGGWVRTKPDKELAGTPRTRLWNEIISSYDGTELSIDAMRQRLAVEYFDRDYMMNPEIVMEKIGGIIQKTLGLNHIPWTDVEKRQARSMISSGNVNDLVKMIKEKSMDNEKWHIPADLKEEVNRFLDEENRGKLTIERDRVSGRGRTPQPK